MLLSPMTDAAVATTPDERLDDLALLDIDEVKKLGGFKTSTLYAWMDQGLWPRQVRLSARCVRWPAGEVRQVLQARIAGVTAAQLVELINRLHARRLERQVEQLIVAVREQANA